MVKNTWDKLLTDVRRKDKEKTKSSYSAAGTRIEKERDFDRILFSTPIRRLADKTQVFPLEKNDSVRTRLTHSHEVSNIARSIGTALCYETGIFKDVANAERQIPPVLAAVGLAHDIGNPPFGHQGEYAIASWFEKNKGKVFSSAEITDQMKRDYLQFEGNAQAFRILTRLQILNDKFGMNLTCCSLSSIMKYPSPSDKVDKKVKSRSKFGYFFSEQEIAAQVWNEVGLREGLRHPFVYIMEASDDIAYSILDAEDAIKKGLVSYYDLVEFLKRADQNDEIINEVVTEANKVHEENRDKGLSPAELNDISMQMFRVISMGKMAVSIFKTFEKNLDKILDGSLEGDLIDNSEVLPLCSALKKFSQKYAYKHKSVLELELMGHNTIHSLMDMLYVAIESRGDPLSEDKHKGTPFQKYAYSRISENYKRVFEDKENLLPLQYKQAQLLADMVSGMTDNFAINFEKELRSFVVAN